MTQLRTRIKICGLSNVDDALFAADVGADAIGLNFHRPSPRFVGLDVAAAIARALPPFVTVVGVFVDATADDVRRALEAVPIAMLQFHGDEPPEFCGQFRIPYLKTLRVTPEVDLLQFSIRYAHAAAILVDAFRPGVPGGTGETFDWGLIPSQRPRQLVLSGGLTSANVGAGIERVRPWAVDVASGVESKPGVKDRTRIGRFIEAVQRADQRFIEAVQRADRRLQGDQAGEQ